MRKAALVALALALTACTKEGPKTDNELVREVAQEAYAHLIAGEVDEYLAMLHDFQGMEPDYQGEMRDLMAQFLDKEQRAHGGLTAATAVADTVTDSTAMVRMTVTYADSLQEAVSVSLVRKDGRWMLK